MSERRATYRAGSALEETLAFQLRAAGIAFDVPGQPVPKQSFRYTGANGKGGGYTPARVKNWQQEVAFAASLAMAGRDPFTGAVKVTLTFKLPTRRRVDADNLSKCVLDALNGIIFADDAQVVDLHIRKVYTTPPGVSVEIREATA